MVEVGLVPPTDFIKAATTLDVACGGAAGLSMNPTATGLSLVNFACTAAAGDDACARMLDAAGSESSGCT